MILTYNISLKMKLKAIFVALSAFSTYLACHLWEITVTNFEAYLAIFAVITLDGLFGIIAGIKREGFQTRKALKIGKTLFTWIVILTVLLLIEEGIEGTFWLSETFLIPFVLTTMTSVVKNASLAGLIESQITNKILDRIDQHKGERVSK